MLLTAQEATAARLVVIDRYPNPIAEYVVAICGACAAGRARAQARSGLPTDAIGVTLDTLAPEASQDQAFAAVCQLVAVPFGWLALAGDYGVGKTTLIYAALNALAQRGIYGAYLTAPALLDMLRDKIRDTDGHAHSALLQRFYDLPVLAIDELDKYRPTDYAEEQIFKLFDERYRRRRTHATLIGYNLDRAETIPPFLRSRIGDKRHSQLIEIYGPDIRSKLTREEG